MEDVWISFDDLNLLYDNHYKFKICEINFGPFWSRIQQDMIKQVSVQIFHRILDLTKVLEAYIHQEVTVALVTHLHQGYKIFTATTNKGTKRVITSVPTLIPGEEEEYYIIIPKKAVKTKNQLREVKRMVKMIRESVERFLDEKWESINNLLY